ncbi:MAG: VOC family protein [Rhodospirillales bacterium]|nr:VOC family protein [Rhodospirillales bacterium]
MAGMWSWRPMPNLDNLKKRAKTLVKQHRDRYYPVVEKLRAAVPRFAGLKDREILDAAFTLADAHHVVAREAGFASWALATKELKKSPNAGKPAQEQPQSPRLCVAYPQVFVTDVKRAAEFYSRKLGFSIAYLYGEPPFYGLVSRNGVGLNLRHVDSPVMPRPQTEEESLLSASLVVDGVKELFLEFKRRGVDFAQTLKLQPWDATDFIVRDPDGNLICFFNPASDNDRLWSKAPPRA